MNTTSPKSSLAKFALHTKAKPLRVMILGQSGVGKTALTVRFVTNKFIGDYDPFYENMYTTNSVIDNDEIAFEILDPARTPDESECVGMDANIRWADAFILMYSVTDKCSFDECNRLKFLINYVKRRRKLGSNSKDGVSDIPVILVGNKTDQSRDRMVTCEDGQRRGREMSCACFHELSVREDVEAVHGVFRDVYRFWRVFNKFPKLKRSTSDVQNATDLVTSPDSTNNCLFYEPKSLNHIDTRRSFLIIDPCTQEHDKTDSTIDEMGSSSSCSSKSELDPPFRSRASTDGTLLSRPRRWRYPPPGCVHSNRVERRMSISTRGSNASY